MFQKIYQLFHQVVSTKYKPLISVTIPVFYFQKFLTEYHNNADFFFSYQDVSGSGGDWRFELRVRYLPLDLAEIYDKDPLTFSSYYDQVVNDYLHKNFDSLDQELAIQLG